MSRQAFVKGDLHTLTSKQALTALNHRWALAAAGDFTSDVDVLNYALTLEYLEATFYEQGNAANLVSTDEAKYLTAIQKDEEYHVTAITGVIKQLGGTPVAKPSVNFGDAFKSRTSFLTTSVTFENVGVGAYLGAAGFIKDKTVLQAAAGIFGVEARHAAVVGNILGLTPEGGVYKGAFETPIEKATVLKAVTPFLTQMTVVPSGSVDTGGGSASAKSETGVFALGGAALVGAAGAALYANRKREAADSAQ